MIDTGLRESEGNRTATSLHLISVHGTSTISDGAFSCNLRTCISADENGDDKFSSAGILTSSDTDTNRTPTTEMECEDFFALENFTMPLSLVKNH